MDEIKTSHVSCAIKLSKRARRVAIQCGVKMLDDIVAAHQAHRHGFERL